MLKDKKVIIFDMDGTLIDSVGIWNTVDKELIAQLGAHESDEMMLQTRRDELIRSYSQMDDAYLEYCHFLAYTYNPTLSKEDVRSMRYAIATHYLTHVIDFKPDAPALLHYLKEQGYQLAIASTTSQKILQTYMDNNERMKQKVDFASIFSLVLGRETIRNIKPHPEVHHFIMDKLRVKAHECLIIEDSVVGVEAANRAGIDVIVMADAYSKGDEKILRESSLGYCEDFMQLFTYFQSH